MTWAERAFVALLTAGVTLGTFAVGLSACGHLAQATTTCASSLVKAQGPHLLPLVADVFMHGQGDLETELLNLATVIGADGWAVVHCVVEQYLGQRIGTLGAPADEARGHARAADWLARHPK